MHIAGSQGVLSDGTTHRLLNYQHIAEIHVSHNEGARDAHASLQENSYGLGWAKERLPDLPVVLECYMHKLTPELRAKQIAMLRS